MILKKFLNGRVGWWVGWSIGRSMNGRWSRIILRLTVRPDLPVHLAFIDRPADRQVFCFPFQLSINDFSFCHLTRVIFMSMTNPYVLSPLQTYDFLVTHKYPALLTAAAAAVAKTLLTNIALLSFFISFHFNHPLILQSRHGHTMTKWLMYSISMIQSSPTLLHPTISTKPIILTTSFTWHEHHLTKLKWPLWWLHWCDDNR